MLVLDATPEDQVPTTDGLPAGVESMAPLEEADLALLRAESERGLQAPASRYEIREIRSQHHRVAALLGAGFSTGEAARYTGYHPQTVGRLAESPAFKELIAHYAKNREEKQNELQFRTEMTALRLLDEIDARLDDEEARAKIPFPHLVESSKAFLDRAGQGPVSRQENKNVHLHFSPERLGQLREEARSIRFAPGQAGLLPVPPDRGAGVGEDRSEGALAGYEQGPDGGAEEGPGV